MAEKAASSADLYLYSDGGSTGGRSAAGACVLEDRRKNIRNCFAIYLGSGTNNEAEILASLLGFSAIHALEGDEASKLPIHWVADSEYVLKSATAYINNWQRNGWKTADKKPVKNQGLWRTYLSLTRGLKIQVQHVRGHTGHPENEACDTAVQFVKDRGDDLFLDGPIAHAEIETHIGVDSWTCIDGQEVMDQLRMEEPEEEHHFSMLALLGGRGGSSKLPHTVIKRPSVLSAVRLKLQQARDLSSAESSKNPQLHELTEEIDRLLAEFRD